MLNNTGKTKVMAKQDMNETMFCMDEPLELVTFHYPQV